MRTRSLSVLAAAFLAMQPAAAQTKKPMTIDDLWAMQRVGSPVVSPDGRKVAYTVATYDMDENRSNADIVVRDLTTGTVRKLTTAKAGDSSPAWSPDGTHIAFVSRREDDKASQIYVIPTDGGEARRITSMPISASSPKFTPDGRRIVFVSSVLDGFESLEATKKELEAREKSKAKVRVTENRIYRYWDAWLTDGEQMRLFSVDLEGGKPVDLLPGWKGLFDLIDSGQTIDFDLSPDGASIAFAANVVPAPYRTSNKDVFVMPLAGGTPRNLTKDNPAEDSSPRWSPNGKTLAFGRETKGDGYPDRTRLALLDVASGRVEVLTEAWDNVPSGWQFTADGKTLVFKAEVRARTGLYTLPVSGGTPKRLLRGGTVGGMEVSSKDEILFSLSTFDTAPEIHLLPLVGGTPKPVSQVNDALMAKFAFGRVEDVTFPGAGGDDVQMFILYPPDFTPTKKWPLVHMIHGGPVGTFGDGWSYRWNPQLFAAPGYVVAMVNFHGSSSFGQRWVESILGAHADKPFTDVMKATDFLLAKGFVDEKRMAAAGGSYGGYLVNWIAGHTDRFASLISHAGVYSLHGQMASDGTLGRQHSYGGFPFTNLENVEKWSPNRYSKNFTTPMLVLHGEKDYRVPVTQGLELYGNLQAKGVPSRLVYFTEENHWVLKGQNSVKWYGEVLGWLARWFEKGR